MKKMFSVPHRYVACHVSLTSLGEKMKNLTTDLRASPLVKASYVELDGVGNDDLISHKRFFIVAKEYTY